MAAIEKVFVLNLETEQLRAGITVGNLLTQQVPQQIIELFPAIDGRNKRAEEVVDLAIADGFSAFDKYKPAFDRDDIVLDPINLAIEWSYRSVFRKIDQEISNSAIFILDDCMLSDKFWNINHVAECLFRREEPFLLCQLGRWEPATHKFDEPAAIVLEGDNMFSSRVVQELAFGDYGTIITSAGARTLLDAADRMLWWQMERHIRLLQGTPGVYSLYPPVYSTNGIKTLGHRIRDEERVCKQQ